MQVYTIYEAIINSDGTEGRGYDVVIGRFFTRTAAEMFVRGKDVMGTDGTVKSQTAIKDDDGMYRVLGPAVAVARDALDIKRLNALAKLDPEERKLLGLS